MNYEEHITEIAEFCFSELKKKHEDELVDEEDMHQEVYCIAVEAYHMYVNSKACIAYWRKNAMKLTERFYENYLDQIHMESIDIESVSYEHNFEHDLFISEDVAWAISTLTPREIALINYRFGFTDGDTHTLEETCSELHASCRERIRQWEAHALRKLRHPYRTRRIRAYW